MSEESREFPASELKLSRLRAQGVIPTASEMLDFAVLLGLIAGALLFYNILAEQIIPWAKKLFDFSLAGSDGTTIRDNMFSALQLIFVGTVSLVGVVLLAVLVVGFCQTKFLFVPSLVVPDFSRLINRPRILELGLLKVFSGFAVYLLRMTLFLVLALMVLRYAFEFLGEEFPAALASHRSIAGPPNSSATLPPPRSEWQKLPLAYRPFIAELARLYLLLFGVSLLIGILSWILASINYRNSHRMTRGEMEAELRETEPSASFKERRAVFFH